MADPCTVPRCPDPQLTKKSGLCSKHYQRVRRHGSTDACYIRGNDLARFWSHVDQRGPDDCHPWTSSLRHGYGQFSVGGKTVQATRYLIKVVLGEPLDDDQDVCHHCDNPPCMNRRHLFIDDASGNIIDMVAKGRWGGSWGERHPHAALTEDQVREIRATHAAGLGTWRGLAAEYGVHRSTIERILLRKTWTHLP